MTVATITWQGEVKPTKDPENRLCTFLTMEDGIRAGTIDLLSYYFREELDTIDGIISRYANSKVDNNNTEAYITFMEKWCSVDRRAALVMTNKPFLILFVGGIIRFEMGFSICTAQDIAQGVARALAHSVH